MAARGSGGIREILDAGTDFRRLSGLFGGFSALPADPAAGGGYGRSWRRSRSGPQPMTRPAGTCATAGRPPESKHEASCRDALADPRARLGVGLATLLATASVVHRDRVGGCEAGAFRAVNGLPDALYPPAWIIMQLGAFGAVPASAAAAWRAGDGELAARLLLGGTGAWALAKLVKQAVRRPRPVTLLPGSRCRGREAAGLGYLSGHAAVAVALGVAALPRLGPAARALALTAVPLVGLTRLYVGAHLPLDIAGGAALGLAAEAAAGLVTSGAPDRCAAARHGRASR
jgi:undecaprenyl-diphosphatase